MADEHVFDLGFGRSAVKGPTLEDAARAARRAADVARDQVERMLNAGAKPDDVDGDLFQAAALELASQVSSEVFPYRREVRALIDKLKREGGR